MASYRIRLFPEPILRRSALFVREFDQNLRTILQKLHATMKAQPAGIGIAAPQVGISKRIAIVDVSSREPSGTLLHLVNPEILVCEEEISSREGCMSLPEYTATIKRFNKIKVRWQDEGGRYQEKWSTGIEARCIQHEVDHLNGLLFIDKVASLKTDVLPRTWKRKGAE